MEEWEIFAHALVIEEHPRGVLEPSSEVTNPNDFSTGAEIDVDSLMDLKEISEEVIEEEAEKGLGASRVHGEFLDSSTPCEDLIQVC